MNIDQSQQIAQAYSWLRAISGGKLTQAQVDAGDVIIAANGLEVFSNLIGFKLNTTVTGLRDISEKGYALIREFEGFRANAYLDSAGIWTIGFGTIKINGKPVKKGDTCTKEQAEQWLKLDCLWVDACLDKYITIVVTQNQFDALASLVYNIGETAFKSSTLLTKLNAGDFKAAADNFDRWVNAGGKRLQGLVNRRAKEKELFLK
ncbi:lysozyme [Acinetobacter sp. ANC 4558]|uniref:lysozyme n=1 Tax=Acinetobacter sp. ANC 4558 TaxID=1977876 RepID=UPI000A336271|nr:lysozyme [Acinetobacter sp. ANC 4558]OTG87179.1 lysozyme [Acinetobacter sp. ANC 4558]